MARGDQAPTGAARRRIRISDAETERRMLDAALEIIATRGMSVSLEHLSLEEVIATAGVSRSSAYRRWPYKDLFFSDLLVELARSTNLEDEGAEPLRQAQALLAARVQELRTDTSRRDLIIEVLRTAVQADFEGIYSSPRWRTYITLNATFLGLPDGDLQRTVGAALAQTEQRFTTHRAQVAAEMTDVLGYRLVPPLTAPDGFELMAGAVGSTITGLVIKALASPQLVAERRLLRAFGSTRPAEWSVPAFVIVGVALSYIEPDPAVRWDQARIRTVAAQLSQRLQTS
jgi:AcrR family transcriptional regulator